MNDRQPALRASDADREHVARILGELALDAPGPSRRPVGHRVPGVRRDLAAAGASGSFWPIWVILLAAVGLARAGWRTLGPGAGLTDEELNARRRGRRGRLRR